MFELLFKYPALYFQQGSLILALPWWQLALLPLALFALVFVALGYFHLRHRAARRDRLVMALLRSLALSLLLFSLSRPLLEVDSPVAQPNVVALLFDNSISMRLPGESGDARAEFVRRQFDAGDGDLLRDLRARFDTRLFGFGADFDAIDSVAALDFGAGASDLAQALGRAREALRGEPLAGLVVVTDGAAGWSEELEHNLLELRAAGIPVHSIGLGQARYARDIELRQVRLPQRLLRGSRAVAEITLSQQGYDGEEVELRVEDDSRLLHQQQLRLLPGRQVVKLPLEIEDSGARQLKFELTPLPGELISENNTRYAMPSVSDRKLRVLHFEGEPRFELKFIRRAVADDDSLRISGLIRTADAKFYRVGVESEDQLRDGFPLTRAELFAYDALILGSVEVGLLSEAQQQMVVDFVGQRGGGLLLLGGRHAFAEGGYADSMLREIMPVVIADEAQPDFTRQVKIEPTPSAWVHPALLLDDDRETSIERWLSLPPLTMVNPLRQVKPGADLLLGGISSADEAPLVAMAAQRYGRGKVVAFAVQNSWLWQMHEQIEIDDQSHELLWRQLLRWLIEDVPQRMSLTQSATQTFSGGQIELRSEILDGDYEALEKAQPQVVMTLPDGREQRHALRPDPRRRGLYLAEIPASVPGEYLLHAELESAPAALRSPATRLRVSRAGSEYHDSELDAALLQRVAQTTGGRVFAAADSDELVARLDARQRESRVLTRLELWDMPILFALLVLLLCAEWGYRRWRNLV